MRSCPFFATLRKALIHDFNSWVPFISQDNAASFLTVVNVTRYPHLNPEAIVRKEDGSQNVGRQYGNRFSKRVPSKLDVAARTVVEHSLRTQTLLPG